MILSQSIFVRTKLDDLHQRPKSGFNIITSSCIVSYLRISSFRRGTSLFSASQGSQLLASILSTSTVNSTIIIPRIACLLSRCSVCGGWCREIRGTNPVLTHWGSRWACGGTYTNHSPNTNTKSQSQPLQNPSQKRPNSTQQLWCFELCKWVLKIFLCEDLWVYKDTNTDLQIKNILSI